MDKAEAREVLARELAPWRLRGWDDLAARAEGPPVTFGAVGRSGKRYQVELQVFWDAAPGGTVRVRGAIDDGGLRAFFPLVDDFLLSPDGSFVGEDAPTPGR